MYNVDNLKGVKYMVYIVYVCDIDSRSAYLYMIYSWMHSFVHVCIALLMFIWQYVSNKCQLCVYFSSELAQNVLYRLRLQGGMPWLYLLCFLSHQQLSCCYLIIKQLLQSLLYKKGYIFVWDGAEKAGIVWAYIYILWKQDHFKIKPFN